MFVSISAQYKVILNNGFFGIQRKLDWAQSEGNLAPEENFRADTKKPNLKIGL
jgi:hypothetical protein